MLGINFLFILRKSVNFSVILFSNQKMNSTIVLSLMLVMSVLLTVIVVDASLMKTAADSLLPIVQSQRERFRVRAQELETVRL